METDLTVTGILINSAKSSRLSHLYTSPHQKCPTSTVNNVSRLVFLDLCAWQYSTEEIETSDLAFNGGEDGAVHLKRRPLTAAQFC